jgi:hypothetical protein
VDFAVLCDSTVGRLTSCSHVMLTGSRWFLINSSLDPFVSLSLCIRAVGANGRFGHVAGVS